MRRIVPGRLVRRVLHDARRLPLVPGPHLSRWEVAAAHFVRSRRGVAWRRAPQMYYLCNTTSFVAYLTINILRSARIMSAGRRQLVLTVLSYRTYSGAASSSVRSSTTFYSARGSANATAPTCSLQVRSASNFLYYI